jgi:hypothetical protein
MPLESLTRVLEIVFAKHYIALICLSLSWLLISGVRSLGDLLTRKLFLRAPLYLWVRLKRRELGLPNLRHAIASGEPAFAGASPELDLAIEKLYGSFDYKISRIRSGRHWVTKFLSKESINNELRQVAYNEWALLESDSALSKAASPDPKASRIGLLSSVGNQSIPMNEVRGVLFHSLRFGLPDIKQLALFHITPAITSSDQLEKLESIVPTLPASMSLMAASAVQEIRDRLSVMI